MIKRFNQFINEGQFLSYKIIERMTKQQAYDAIVELINYIGEEYAGAIRRDGCVILDSCEECLIDGEPISGIKPGFILCGWENTALPVPSVEHDISRLLELPDEDVINVLSNLYGTAHNEIF